MKGGRDNGINYRNTHRYKFNYWNFDKSFVGDSLFCVVVDSKAGECNGQGGQYSYWRLVQRFFLDIFYGGSFCKSVDNSGTLDI